MERTFWPTHGTTFTDTLQCSSKHDIYFCPEDSLSLCNHTTHLVLQLRFHIMACLWNISLSEFTTWSFNHYTAFHINHSSIDGYLVSLYIFFMTWQLILLIVYLSAHVCRKDVSKWHFPVQSECIIF